MYWLPITYVSITMVIALLGNLLVIIVFKCRWRTTGATQIYILSLAALDLACAIASMPHLLVAFVAQRDSTRGTNSSDCLICRDDSYMQGFCKVTVFLTYQLNLTTALILVVIATCRCVRVINEGRGFRFQDRVKVKSMKVRLMKILNAMSTVPGAKTTSAVCFCVALVMTCPTIAFYASNGDRDKPKTDYTGNTTPEPEQQHCFRSCLNDIHEDYKTPLNTLLSFYFVIFLVLAAAMIILYSAILRKLWEKRKEKTSDSHNHRQSSVFGSRRYRQSSVFVSRQSGSLGTLCEAVHKAVLDSKRQVVRTMSEGDAVATNPEGNKTEGAHTEIRPSSVSSPCNSTDKGSIMSKVDAKTTNPEENTTGGAHTEIHPRSDSSPYTNRDKERIMQGITGGHPRPRCESDPSRGEGVESQRKTLFPPVSYTAQLRSMLSLNVAERVEEEQASVRSRHVRQLLSDQQAREQGEGDNHRLRPHHRHLYTELPTLFLLR
ncbi:uncharacterized protein [Littorina saxatilis]|uniref:uncharacterized protein n=1 Tax=Littorina saxatilis TaxID=31220 RepID=UPI0038B5A8D7